MGEKRVSQAGETSTQENVLAIIMLVTSIAPSNAIASMATPILPPNLKTLGIAYSFTGIILLTAPLIVLFLSVPISRQIQRRSRYFVLVVGTLCCGISCVLFGRASDIAETVCALFSIASDNLPEHYKDEGVKSDDRRTDVQKYLTLGLFLLARVVIGYGSGCVNQTAAALALQRFPKNPGVVMGLNETLVGAGFCMGPSVGSFLYVY